MSVNDHDNISTQDDFDDYTFGASFEDTTLQGSKLEFYKGQQGKTDRLAILLTQPIGVRIHYINGNFVCLTKGNGPQQFCCEKLGMPGLRFGTIVAQYLTDNSGKVLDPNKYVLKAWMLSESKFFDLRLINSEYPLSELDLKVTCEEAGFQKLKFIPCRDSLIRMQPNIDSILKQVKLLEPKIKTKIAQKITLDEYKSKLGLEVVAAKGNPPTTKVNFSDMSDLDN